MNEIAVGSLMTRDVVTVEPGAPFRELAAVMTRHGISAVPVVDGRGRPIGVVSEADLLAKQEFHGGRDEVPHGDKLARERWFRAQGRNAAEVMTTPVRVVSAGTGVSVAARLFATAGVRRLFVTDWYGRLIGVVSRRDLLRVYVNQAGERKSDVGAHC